MDLNKNYCFESFVVGPSNQFAYAASIAVAERPGKEYNPFIIYGDAALGKTHLSHAIGLEILSKFPGFDITYVTAEAFKKELIASSRLDKIRAFRDRYLDMDCILMDDIQSLAGAEKTQDAFSHILRSFYEMKKQVVITCDKFPLDIRNIEGRKLLKRLERMLIADIQQPADMETKTAIAARMAHDLGLTLPIDFIQSLVLKTDTMKEINDKLLAYSLLQKRK